MSEHPKIVHTRSELRDAGAGWRAVGETIALVPTMGALHDGHLALVRLAKAKADRVIVSIFVNPTQFAPHEDFGRYPRTLDADSQKLAVENVDLIYAPSADEMYPAGFATRIVPDAGPALGLESDARPHFFGGVATVVSKLFLQARPDIAIFGEKDWQQLQVVRRMVKDLDLGIEVVSGPTVREADGLALSSRNAYLSPEDRAVAPILHRVLVDSAALIGGGAPMNTVLQEAREAVTNAGFSVDYLEGRHAYDLTAIEGPHHGPVRLLVAARIGGTRLIDNVAVPSDAH
ncbi:pantoate--beta-alanine ligase [Terrihabitans sp. B22-R8]|uniref:pantoate--beta-alanine ligase n=1 Tax=Terrihabitans sp. B22-R8 TaxID=3425128 RepID=UPI00403D41CC